MLRTSSEFSESLHLEHKESPRSAHQGSTQQRRHSASGMKAGPGGPATNPALQQTAVTAGSTTGAAASVAAAPTVAPGFPGPCMGMPHPGAGAMASMQGMGMSAHPGWFPGMMPFGPFGQMGPMAGGMFPGMDMYSMATMMYQQQAFQQQQQYMMMMHQQQQAAAQMQGLKQGDIKATADASGGIQGLPQQAMQQAQQAMQQQTAWGTGFGVGQMQKQHQMAQSSGMGVGMGMPMMHHAHSAPVLPHTLPAVQEGSHLGGAASPELPSLALPAPLPAPPEQQASAESHPGGAAAGAAGTAGEGHSKRAPVRSRSSNLRAVFANMAMPSARQSTPFAAAAGSAQPAAGEPEGTGGGDAIAGGEGVALGDDVADATLQDLLDSAAPSSDPSHSLSITTTPTATTTPATTPGPSAHAPVTRTRASARSLASTAPSSPTAGTNTDKGRRSTSVKRAERAERAESTALVPVEVKMEEGETETDTGLVSDPDAKVPLPALGASPVDATGVQGPGQVIYVSARRAAAILRRREQRAKLDAEGRGGAGAMRVRKPYLHQSRHDHAQRRIRGPGGRFLSAQEKALLLAEEAAQAGPAEEGMRDDGDASAADRAGAGKGTAAGGSGAGPSRSTSKARLSAGQAAAPAALSVGAGRHQTPTRTRGKRSAPKSRPGSPAHDDSDEQMAPPVSSPAGQASQQRRPGSGSSKPRAKKSAGGAMAATQHNISVRAGPLAAFTDAADALLVGGQSETLDAVADALDSSDPALAPLELTSLVGASAADGGLLLPPGASAAAYATGHGEDADDELLLLMSGDLMHDLWSGGAVPLVQQPAVGKEACSGGVTHQQQQQGAGDVAEEGGGDDVVRELGVVGNKLRGQELRALPTGRSSSDSGPVTDMSVDTLERRFVASK